MLNDPFVRLILYLLLAWAAVWALGEVAKKSEWTAESRRIAMVIAGVVLVVIAFYLSGILSLLQ